MGLNIKDIIPRHEIEISDLKGKLLVVDAFNSLYQFLTTIRQPDGTPLMDSKKRVTSHLSGIFYRNIALLQEGIKLVYVFDGIPPEQKIKTHLKRNLAKEIASQRYESAKDQEDIDMMRRYSSSNIRLNNEMIEESKELLRAMGISVVQAPGEGEAEAAFLTRSNESFAAVSQDYDSLLFGAPRLIRNLTLSRKRKTPRGFVEIKPEIIELDRVLNHLNINLDQLICIGIMVGTDYNPRGVPGIGQKKALQIVREKKQPILIFESIRDKLDLIPDEDKFDWKEIFELFHKPNVSHQSFIFPQIDFNAIKEILVSRHEFSEERVNNYVDKLKNMVEKNKQKGLDKWF